MIPSTMMTEMPLNSVIWNVTQFGRIESSYIHHYNTTLTEVKSNHVDSNETNVNDNDSNENDNGNGDSNDDDYTEDESKASKFFNTNAGVMISISLTYAAWIVL